MKTQERNFLISINNQPLCERNLLLSLCLQPWLWARGLCTLVRKKLLILQQFAHAELVPLVGQNVQLRPILEQINRRVFVGLGLMGVVAPVASCSYMFFDRGVYYADWYYVNHFHLFLVLGPSLFIMSCLVGIWFLFPYRSARAYALIVPAGFTVGKMLWLAQCTSNNDFYSIVPASFILLGALISVFLFVASDWLVHNVFHRQDAFERRIGTLYNGADLVDGETFKMLFKKSVEEKKQFQKQY